MKFKARSHDAIFALYAALHASRSHAIAVRFSNVNLKFCLGKTKGQRLSKPQLREFAKKFEPIFPHHSIVPERYGDLSLVLYFNKKDDPAHEEQIRDLMYLKPDYVYKELGIELIDN